MEKRVLLAIFLSFLVLYAFQGLFETPKPKAKAIATTAAGTETGKAGAAGTPKPSGTSASTAGSSGRASAASTRTPAAEEAPAAVLAATSEQDIRVETDDVEAVFTNRGGELKSWKLKHYLDRDGKPLELVVTQVMKSYPYPFSLRVEDPALTSRLNDALYVVKGVSGGEVDARSGPVTLTFEYQDTAGLRVRKQFTVQPKSYILTFQMAASNGSQSLNPTVEWGPGLGDVWNSEMSRYVQKPEGLVFHTNTGKVERLSPKDLSKQPSYEGDFSYVGVDDNYFMSTLLFPGTVHVQYEPLAIPESSAPKATVHDLIAYQVQPEKTDVPLKFFFGPKDFDVLASIDRNLVRAINFGWFSFLVGAAAARAEVDERLHPQLSAGPSLP